jgi:hypothetical protein
MQAIAYQLLTTKKVNWWLVHKLEHVIGDGKVFMFLKYIIINIKAVLQKLHKEKLKFQETIPTKSDILLMFNWKPCY